MTDPYSIQDLNEEATTQITEIERDAARWVGSNPFAADHDGQHHQPSSWSADPLVVRFVLNE